MFYVLTLTLYDRKVTLSSDGFIFFPTMVPESIVLALAPLMVPVPPLEAAAATDDGGNGAAFFFLLAVPIRPRVPVAIGASDAKAPMPPIWGDSPVTIGSGSFAL